MFATSLFSVMSAINGRYNMNSRAMNADQGMQALAGSVGPSSDINTVASMDKALALESAHSKVMFAAYQAMQEDAQKRLKADLELQQRLNKNWYA